MRDEREGDLAKNRPDIESQPVTTDSIPVLKPIYATASVKPRDVIKPRLVTEDTHMSIAPDKE